MAKQVVSLYGGKVELSFEPGRHRYAVTIPSKAIVAEKVPSVTSVTGILDKPGLPSWAANMATLSLEETILPDKPYTEAQLDAFYRRARYNFRDVKQAAADIGSAAHEHIEQHLLWLRGLAPAPAAPEEGPVSLCCKAAKDWLSAHKVKVVETERILYSMKHHIAGKGDKFAMVDGEFCYTDWKSSKGIYAEAVLQSCAYAMMYDEEQRAIKGLSNGAAFVQAVWIVKLGKEDGEFDALRFPREVIEEVAKGFAAAVSVFRCVKSIEERLGR
jgi:hypothetical protein